MSKTYKKTNKGYKTDWLPNIRSDDVEETYWCGWYLKPTEKAKQWIKKNPHRKKDLDNYFLVDYSKNPGWYNNLFFYRPKRRHDANLLKKIKNNEIDADDAIWYNEGNKPKKYYW